MTADTFRKMALALPASLESSHMNHPDFRVSGKIFATLGPNEEWGMVKLTPGQQASCIQVEPNMFTPANGAWGRGGATIVQLREARMSVVKPLMMMAWRNTASQRLVDSSDPTS